MEKLSQQRSRPVVASVAEKGIWEPLLAELEAQSARIANQTAEKLLATVPGYAQVPKAALAASAVRNIALSIRTIRAGDGPAPSDVPEADDLANERMGQGVPLGSVLSGFRLSMLEILHWLVELSPEHDIPPDRMLDCSTLLWSLGDVFSARATAVYQEREIKQALADSVRRSEWIQRAVADGVGAQELLWGAATYDVPTEVPVRALAAPAGMDSGGGVEERLHQWAVRGGARLLATVRSSVIVGILIGNVDENVPGPGFVVGVGEPVLLSELPRSFAQASLALRAGETLGMGSAVDVKSLSWRLAVHTSPETTEILRHRYLAALGETGAFKEELLVSVRAYLENRLSIPAAAKSLPVHVNTMRYRLRRFEELTGADLGEVDTMVELSWVLATMK